MSPEVIAYLILGLADKLGSVAAARSYIDAKKADGKSFDQILDELEADRKAAAAEAHDAVDEMDDE